MKLRTFIQNKLWRDKAASMLAEHGSSVDAKILNDEEFKAELKTKIQEEVAEVVAASSDKEILAECADVLEVMIAIGSAHGFLLQDIIEAQEKRREHRGGFEARMFVRRAHHPTGSFGEAYCLKDPLKYPEIIG